ncbi:MAG: DNA polymerase III subunit delta', partial [Hyphomicrobiaceae bacterium]
LLQGPEGIGKATLAYHLARHVFAHHDDALFSPEPGDGLHVDMQSVSSRQVVALSHPGLLVIRRQWDPKRKKFQSTIAVDEVRRLRGFLGLSADAGAWRVVIVDRADDMNMNAANALLKSLEEPPSRCIFLLIASEPGRLPVTIHSRCRRLNLAPLGPDDLKIATEHVVEASELSWPDDIDWTTLHRLSQGSVRRAVMLVGEDGLALYMELMDILGVLPKMDRARTHGLAESLAVIAQEARFNLFLDLLQDTLARMIRSVARAGDAAAGDDIEGNLAQRVIAPERLAQWSELWETLARERAEARLLNLDRQSLILGFFERIGALAKADR